MGTTPSLLLVHGAWHGPWAWRQLIDQLPDIDVHTVALPTSGDDPAMLGDLYDDAAVVSAAVAAVSGPVVVVAHSYGGAPVTQALADADNVRRIVYLAAFQPDVGDSLFSSAGNAAAPWWEVHEQEDLRGKGHRANSVADAGSSIGAGRRSCSRRRCRRHHRTLGAW
jgi:pimeloyl-ACP methyl ester carboxylesterase